MIGVILSSVLVLGIGFGIIFMYTSPQFGGRHSKQNIAHYQKSRQYKNGAFVNAIETPMSMGFKGTLQVLKEYIKGVKDSEPSFDIPVDKIDSLDFANKKAGTRVVWFGHSAFLIQIDSLNILLDPMFGNVAAPLSILGKPRYGSLPIEIDKLPSIDAIILSHDHYDHLDYGSIKALKDKTKAFFMPLGCGAHFRSWDVEDKRIHEMDWWDKTSYQGLELVLTPSRHFSGRGFNDQKKTLWGSWVIKGQKDKLYFSGDSGYGPHFKEIGDKYGPFDFAMVECGQYNKRWENIHMMPEQTAQAAVDVKAKVMMPIHWAAFTLSLHTWTDPVERVVPKAKELGQSIIVPKIGQIVHVRHDMPVKTLNPWWVNPSTVKAN